MAEFRSDEDPRDRVILGTIHDRAPSDVAHERIKGDAAFIPGDTPSEKVARNAAFEGDSNAGPEEPQSTEEAADADTPETKAADERGSDGDKAAPQPADAKANKSSDKGA